MTAEKYDHIVIGAGIEGSFTAYQLAKRGTNTLLVEQYSLGHGKGSSHGLSRIIRRSYQEEFFARLMDEAYEEWFEIEKLIGKTIYTKTGILCVVKEPFDILDQISETSMKLNNPHQILNTDELKLRFPSLNYPNHKGLYEENAGVLNAAVALQSAQELFRREGGVIKDNLKVTGIKPGNPVTVQTQRGILHADSVVICVGPWARKFLTGLQLDLPIQAKKVGVFYWKAHDQENFTKDKFPALIDFNTCTEEVYALPAVEYSNLVKLCYHDGIPCDPDQNNDFKFDKQIQILREYITDYIPGLDTVPTIQETCHYSQTPDLSFILDKHPEYSNIVIGAGFSGTGFKLAPVVGKILADLAEQKTPAHDMEPFRISRFAQHRNTDEIK